jgi:hypothetical protein
MAEETDCAAGEACASKTVTSCASDSGSKPRSTSTLRPFDNNTVKMPWRSTPAIAATAAGKFDLDQTISAPEIEAFIRENAS